MVVLAKSPSSTSGVKVVEQGKYDGVVVHNAWNGSSATTQRMNRGAFKLNATVTLVRSIETSEYVERIRQWIISVMHLTEHTCVLVDSEAYKTWLEIELSNQPHEASLRSRVRVINVGEEFHHCNRNEKLNVAAEPICASGRSGTSGPVGYKNMCRMWFLAVWKHLTDYEFVLRFDLDNDYRRGDWPTDIKKFGAVSCVDGDNKKYTAGLRQTIWDTKPPPTRRVSSVLRVFSRHRNSADGSMIYPYTNVMFVNVKWAVNAVELNNIFRRVDNTNCICTNRWGDLPLWGETLAYLGMRPQLMAGWAYRHGTHNKEISAGENRC